VTEYLRRLVATDSRGAGLMPSERSRSPLSEFGQREEPTIHLDASPSAEDTNAPLSPLALPPAIASEGSRSNSVPFVTEVPDRMPRVSLTSEPSWSVAPPSPSAGVTTSALEANGPAFATNASEPRPALSTIVESVARENARREIERRRPVQEEAPARSRAAVLAPLERPASAGSLSPGPLPGKSPAGFEPAPPLVEIGTIRIEVVQPDQSARTRRAKPSLTQESRPRPSAVAGPALRSKLRFGLRQL
jgi:hypothetical protein